jgi:F-type H+-transporting ATPase subunit delta
VSTVDGYARAIFEAARAEGALEDVEEELFRFGRTLDANPELLQGLADPGVPADRRQAMIEELLTGKVTPQTVQAVSFVVGSGRGRALPDIISTMLDLAATERNKVVADVRTAVPLDDDRKRRLADALGTATGKTVEIRATVDPDVIGGVWAQVGDQVIDGTIRSRLDNIKMELNAG